MVMARTPPEVLTREERIRRFGIDCGADALVWHGWEPGGEITKKLVVKNVSKKNQKLKYVLPKTKFFFMEFPELIVLNPGMSKTIDVVFRPVRLEPYEDYIEFRTSENMVFYVPVRATVPTLSFDIPEMLDFGFCPVRETEVKHFEVFNTGELDVHFKWDFTEPFVLTPSSGVIRPGEALLMQAEFFPTDASVYVATGVCYVEDQTKVLKISGIGKYPFLHLPTMVYDFGRVMVGHTHDMLVAIKNQSPVEARYRLKMVEQDRDPVFRFNDYSGEIGPEGIVQMKLTYTPTNSGTFSSDHFDFFTAGGNTVRIRCIGEAAGPEVFLSQDSLNFNDVVVGRSTSRVLYLQNNSDVPVLYSFQSDPDGVFAFSSIQGKIGPEQTVHLKITFSPGEPGNFYKRVFMLVNNAGPKYVDLLGTAYDDKRRPAPMYQRHIDSFRVRQASGMSRLAPDVIEEVISDGSYDAMVQENLLNDPFRRKIPPEASEGGEKCKWEEYFMDPTDARRAITLSEQELDFGACSRLRMGEYKTVEVTNHSDGKVVAAWAMSASAGSSSSDLSTFSVHPPQLDIEPHSTATFRVAFRPNQDNKYYCINYDLYCYFKNMRSFRLVNDSSFSPPWQAALRTCGHTFPNVGEQFMPKGQFNVKKVQFPACDVHDCVYQTVELRNLADTALKYTFQEDPSGAFRCKPNGGVVEAFGVQVIALRFNPRQARDYQYTLKCVMNNVPGGYDLHLSGTGYMPRISFADEGVMYFKPTCVGAVTRRTYRITNTERIDVRYSVEIPEKYQDLLSIEPASGVVRGNDSAELSASFIPDNIQQYNIRLTCKISSAQIDETLRTREDRCYIFVQGEGAEGALKFDPEIIDYDNVSVGIDAKRTTKLQNTSETNLYYKLGWRRDFFDPALVPPEEPQEESEGTVRKLPLAKPLIEFSEPIGLIPARSTRRIDVIFHPVERTYYSFTLFCFLSSDLEDLEEDGGADKNSLAYLSPEDMRAFEYGPTTDDDAARAAASCEMVGRADFPTVAYTDIRCAGMSQLRLWRMFSLPSINRELSENLSSFNISLNTATGLKEGNPFDLLNWFPCDFGPGEVRQPPTVFHTQLKNVGALPLEFVFKFPNDVEVDVERWADAGEPSEREIKQYFVLDKRLFNIKPRSARLAPGESVRVKFSYQHKFVGLHDLNVILQVDQGKHLVMNLRGRTLLPLDRCVHLLQNEHEFNSVAIGLIDPPAQYYPLYNPTRSPIEYALDLTEVNRLNKENYDFDVLHCENPSGVIPAGERAYLTWIFKPLEAKTYSVNIPVQVVGGEVANINFFGAGYHPSIERPIAKTAPIEIPAVQLLQVPGQFASFNIEQISFGNVPLFSMVRRIVMIRNHHEEAINFAWEDHPYANAVVEVRPRRGLIPRGGHKLCKLVLKTHPRAQLHKLDIGCDVGVHDEEAERLGKTGSSLASSNGGADGGGGHPESLVKSFEQDEGFAMDSATRSIDYFKPRRMSNSRGQNRLSTAASRSSMGRSSYSGSGFRPEASQIIETERMEGAAGEMPMMSTHKETTPSDMDEKHTQRLNVLINANILDHDEFKRQFADEVDRVYVPISSTPEDRLPTNTNNITFKGTSGSLGNSMQMSHGRGGNGRPPRPQEGGSAAAGGGGRGLPARKEVVSDVIQLLLKDIVSDRGVTDHFGTLDSHDKVYFTQLLRDGPICTSRPASERGAATPRSRVSELLSEGEGAASARSGGEEGSAGSGGEQGDAHGDILTNEEGEEGGDDAAQDRDADAAELEAQQAAKEAADAAAGMLDGDDAGEGGENAGEENEEGGDGEDGNDAEAAAEAEEAARLAAEEAERLAEEERRREEEMLELQRKIEEERMRELHRHERAQLLGDPKFCDMLEDILENTVFNLMKEALCGEFNLSALPRRVVNTGARPEVSFISQEQ